MRRARRPLPYDLWGMTIDNNRNYVVTQEGITYKMPYELAMKLKLDYKSFSNIGIWYAQLSRTHKNQIQREGLPPEPVHVYPNG